MPHFDPPVRVAFAGFAMRILDAARESARRGVAVQL
jgi:hypothetical protein